MLSKLEARFDRTRDRCSFFYSDSFALIPETQPILFQNYYFILQNLVLVSFGYISFQIKLKMVVAYKSTLFNMLHKFLSYFVFSRKLPSNNMT